MGLAEFGWFSVVFGSVLLVLGGFTEIWVGLGGFGWVHILVSTHRTTFCKN